MKAFDVVIFSIELDLLELRLQELWDVVDAFIVIESDFTFTGQPKNLTLRDNLERFSWASSKLKVHFVPLRQLQPGEDPFNIEAEMRDRVNAVIKDEGVRPGDMLIFSDVDEIPRATSLALLKACTHWEPAIHLGMQTFLYSFVFARDFPSWRASVHIMGTSPGYDHGRASDLLLADSGWHCSFCFRRLSDFRFKMTAYSHADRVTAPYLLTSEHIQDVVCKGTDIFDMLPEAHDFVDLLQRMRPIPETHSFIDLPKGILLDPAKYAFLLPNGCIREE